MNYIDPDQYLKKARWVWCFILTGILTLLAVCCLPNAKNATLSQIILGIRVMIIFAISYYLAKFIASYQLGIHRDMKQKAEEAEEARQQKQAQKAQQQAVEAHVKQSATQRNADKLSRSKHALVARLGSIDGFIRILQTEPSGPTRTMALQNAHAVMMKLAAELAADEINPEAIDDRQIRELAVETSTDLARIGLADDRLNRDLVRMFKLKKK